MTPRQPQRTAGYVVPPPPPRIGAFKSKSIEQNSVLSFPGLGRILKCLHAALWRASPLPSISLFYPPPPVLGPYPVVLWASGLLAVLRRSYVLNQAWQLARQVTLPCINSPAQASSLDTPLVFQIRKIKGLSWKRKGIDCFRSIGCCSRFIPHPLLGHS